MFSERTGGIDRSFYKEFKKVVELADVVIEVLDARDPLPCRSREVENSVRSSGPEKRIILLLNKIGGLLFVGVCSNLGF